MLYLKKFNENLTTDERVEFADKLKYMTEEYLAYILDNGFQVWTDYNKNGVILLEIYKYEDSNTDTLFKWSEVSDNILTFMEYINDEMIIKKITVTIKNENINIPDRLLVKSYRYEEVIKGSIKGDTNGMIYNFMLHLEEKKSH